ncbi:MAG: hypothetical protein PHO65_03695 [Sulfurovum sp.]|nr:hypothetical protein [Sulfurovum sp.]
MKVIVTILLTLFIAGCSTSQPEKRTPEVTETEKPQAQSTQKYTPPAPPKSSFKPKEVKTNNYTSEYMYPSNKIQPSPVKKEEKTEQDSVSDSMTKEECIAMIGEEKFAKYTEMFSGEAAAIKRCTLLKAMQNH